LDAGEQTSRNPHLPEGGHDFGTRPRNQPVDSWLERFGDWLRSQKLAN
jgi:hypothetical protein